MGDNEGKKCCETCDFLESHSELEPCVDCVHFSNWQGLIKDTPATPDDIDKQIKENICVCCAECPEGRLKPDCEFRGDMFHTFNIFYRRKLEPEIRADERARVVENIRTRLGYIIPTMNETIQIMTRDINEQLDKVGGGE